MRSTRSRTRGHGDVPENQNKILTIADTQTVSLPDAAGMDTAEYNQLVSEIQHDAFNDFFKACENAGLSDFSIYQYTDYKGHEVRHIVVDSKDILKYTNENSGGTWSVAMSERYDIGMPGYMVGMFPERSEWLDASNISSPETNKALLSWASRNADILSQPGCCLGTWLDNGQISLDISQRFLDKDEAIVAAKARNQIAIFGLENGEDIQTGGTGRFDKNGNPII